MFVQKAGSKARNLSPCLGLSCPVLSCFVLSRQSKSHIMEEGRLSIVELEGHNYFVVDQDLSKGDRRSDGPAMATFFKVEAGSTTHNNVRESCRVKKRREVSAPPMIGNRDGGTSEEQVIQKGGRRRSKSKGDADATPVRIVSLRCPIAGIRCAGRNDITRLLWLNEFYFVHEGTIRVRGTCACRRGTQYDS